MDLMQVEAMRAGRTRPAPRTDRVGTVTQCIRVRRRLLLLFCALCFPAALIGEDRTSEDFSALRERAEGIRESAGQLSEVLRIPWVTDVFEGFRLAREERRPVFLYVITGDPLEDC